MAKAVTVIPPSKNMYESVLASPHKKRKVAGYARVSTESEDQATSYQAQIKYYTSYITSRPDWEFVGMYSDEGISATNTKYRDGFNSMVEDALAGKIDLIITKSVSRFARNTVDSISTVRKLKENGVEIFFEKENIWTFDTKGELLITIMSSLAQEESRSISENTTWGKRKRFAEGKCSMSFGLFLGYDAGFKINKEQAEIVKEIYRLFMRGLTAYSIAKEMENRGIPAPGGQARWHAGTINSILTNEKYCGDARLQKSYTVDFLQKKRKKNEGELPQYYVEHHHEAIIEPEYFKLVQAEIARRKDIPGYRGIGLFSNKIKCGFCGGWYGRKVWGSNTKYRRHILRCNQKYKIKGHPCPSPHLTEDEAKQILMDAADKLCKENMEDKLVYLIDTVCRTDELNKELMKLASKYEKKQDVETYAAYTEVKNEIDSREARKQLLEYFLKKYKDGMEEIKEDILLSLLDYIVVKGKGNYTVMFKGGIEVK